MLQFFSIWYPAFFLDFILIAKPLALVYEKYYSRGFKIICRFGLCICFIQIRPHPG